MHNRTTQEFLARGRAVSLPAYRAARRRRFAYTRLLEGLLGDDGRWLTPVVTSSRWPGGGRDASGEVHGLHPRHLATVIPNITGRPAMRGPLGMHDSGLAFGLPITAPLPRRRAGQPGRTAPRAPSLSPTPSASTEAASGAGGC